MEEKAFVIRPSIHGILERLKPHRIMELFTFYNI